MTAARILIFSSCIIFLFGCSSDEVTDIRPQLIGEWRITKVVISDCNDFNDNRSIIVYVACPNSVCHEFAFNENGGMESNAHLEMSSYRESIGSFTASDNTLTYCLDGVSGCFVREVTSVTESAMVWTEFNESSGCITVINLIKL